MKGYVNKDLCIGCGMCCGIAPDAFRMGEDGRADGRAEAKSEGAAAAEAPQQPCPVQATDPS